MTRLIEWWGRCVYGFLCLSILLLGVGRIVLPVSGVSFSSWSISRVVFFNWLIWKVLIRLKGDRPLQKPDRGSLLLPMLLLAGTVTASLFPSPRFNYLGDYRYFIFAFFHYWLVVDMFREAGRRRLLLVLLGIAPGFLLLRGVIAEPEVLNLSLAFRFGYPLDHANTAGYLLAMSIPLSVVLMLDGDRWIRGSAVLSSLSQFVALILTFSRTAWIACVASLFGASILEKRFRRAGVALGVACVVALGASSDLRDRLWSITSAVEDPHVVWRLDALTYAVALGFDHPFLGYGYGRRYLRAALQQKYPDFAQQKYVSHSHNLYAEIVAGTGFLGFAALLWLIASAFIFLIRQIFRREPRMREGYVHIGLFASLVASLVAGFGDVPFYHHGTRIFFFTLLALIQLYVSEDLSGSSRKAKSFSLFV